MFIFILICNAILLTGCHYIEHPVSLLNLTADFERVPVDDPKRRGVAIVLMVSM